MYRGFWINMATLFPQVLTFTFIYENVETLSARYPSYFEANQLSPALFAVALSTLVNHPIETLRKRVMISAYGLTSLNIKVKPMAFVMNLYKQEKVGFLFNGWNMAMLRATVFFLLGWMKKDCDAINGFLYGDSRPLK